MSDSPQAPFEKLARGIFESLQKNQPVFGLEATWEGLRPDQKEIFYKHARALPQELDAELRVYTETLATILTENDSKGG